MFWVYLRQAARGYDVQYISVSVQSLSHVWLFATPWAAAHQASLSITNSWSPPKSMSIESVIPSNLLTRWCPLLLLPSVFPRIRVFSNESALCIRWPKYWNFHFSFSPSNEYSPTPQFKNINSLALRFFYGPTLTSFHDYWKNHSFD